MHARLARYKFSGDAQELAQKAEEGMLPIFQSQTGFKAYSIVKTDNEIFSFSAWDSAEDAEEANKAAAAWVAENMSEGIELTEKLIGEVVLSTTLGVSTTAGVRAWSFLHSARRKAPARRGLRFSRTTQVRPGALA